MITKEYIRQQFRDHIIHSSSVDLEIASGLTALGASLWAITHDSYCNLFWFYCCVGLAIIQVLAAFPFNHLKLRHYSNYLCTVVSVFIVITIYREAPQSEGVGGYFSVALTSLFCAIKTKALLSVTHAKNKK
jgi:hypothetical protein